MTSKNSKPRYWIGEIYGKYTATVIVEASSKKEAQAKLKENDTEDMTDIDYKPNGKTKIIREDKFDKERYLQEFKAID